MAGRDVTEFGGHDGKMPRMVQNMVERRRGADGKMVETRREKVVRSGGTQGIVSPEVNGYGGEGHTAERLSASERRGMIKRAGEVSSGVHVQGVEDGTVDPVTGRTIG